MLPDAVDEDRVLDLMVEWEERRAAGAEPTPEQLTDDPELRAVLGERIRAALFLSPDSTGLSTGGRRDATALDLPAPPPGYRIVRELGRGGMGVVYAAVQEKLNRPVALKTVFAGSGGRVGVMRFLAEAEAVAAVRHPHVVQVHEVGRWSAEAGAERAFLVMEYLTGKSLAATLAENGPLSPTGAARLVAKLADAVRAAHDRQIVHRDLKPANVLFDHAGEPKVTDFGLAKREGGDDLTETGAVLGTPAYMAPEQADGRAKFVGPAADVWALGVILYECLTGQRPFRAESRVALLNAVIHAEPARPRSLAPSLPRDLELVCLKCLRKEPAERYATAKELTDDLLRFLEGRPVVARPVRWPVRAGKWVRRNPVPTALIAAVALGLGGTVGGLVRASNAKTAQLGAEQQKFAAEREKQIEAYRGAIRQAMQQGDGRTALALMDKAVAAGMPENAEVRYDRALSLDMVGEYDALDRQLADIDPADAPPHLQGPVLLLKGERAFQTDPERALELLKAAEASGLSPADAAYIRGLRATRTPDAEREFKKAIELNPRHLYARENLGLLHTYHARLDELEHLARESLLCYPDRPGFKYLRAAVHIGRGEKAQADAILATLDGQLRPAGLESVVAMAGAIHLLRSSTGPDWNPLERVTPLPKKEVAALPPVRGLAGTGGPPFLAPIRRALVEYLWPAATDRLFVPFLKVNEQRLAEMKAAVDAYPEGVFRYMYAYVLFERVEMDIIIRYQNGGANLKEDPERLEKLLLEAGRAMEEVYRSPGGWVDFRVAGLDMAAACYSWAGASQFRADESAAHLAHAAKLARERVERFGPPTNGHTLSAMAAALRDEPDRVFTRRVLQSWHPLGPDPTGAAAYWAVLEFDAQAYPARPARGGAGDQLPDAPVAASRPDPAAGGDPREVGGGPAHPAPPARPEPARGEAVSHTPLGNRFPSGVRTCVRGVCRARTPRRFRSSRNRLRAGRYRPLIFDIVAGQRVAPMCAGREGGATLPQSRKSV
jgi:tetratricopeptide (TPR) repeat protein